ncbi:nose resistant to fluoxetine protein 6-like isoform X2 [Palaemon carinicauda]
MRVWNHPSVLNYIMTILHQNWPATLPDSWGVPGDGILNGNSILWGFQEECTAVVANVTKGFVVPFNATFRGKYCLVHVENTNSSLNYNPSPGSLQEKVYRDILNAPDYYYFGTCMPSSCGESDLVTSYNFSFKNTGWSLVDIRCQTADREYVEKSDGDIAFIVIVSLIWCTIVGAAILEFFVNWAKKPDIRKGPLKYWLVLSSYRSMSNIYKFVNKTNPDVINCLHGLRVMSMIWVTWCHSYSLFSKVTQNLKGLQNISNNVLDQIILNGSFSVDTFFFMSGLLAAYSVFREKTETGRVNWLMYYVHRILRLVPTIALTCFFMATVAKYTLAGPYGPYVESENLQPCREHWYMDVLLVSNFADDTSRCLPQSWYTAADSQLYLILPVILIPLMLNRKIGLIILSAVTVASFAIPCSLYAAFNLKPYLPFAIPEISPEETALNHDHMPWGRASPYFIGVWGGWLLSVYKDRRVKMPLWGVVLGWCVSATVSCLVLLGMAPYNTASAPTELPSGISVFYGGFSRGAWALSLLWVVFACQKGFGGPVNTFLGHACWLPMSRLSYSMFLISVPVQILSSGITMIPLYMNHLNKFIETCGYLFVGGLMATAMAITSEIPVLSLEKAIIPRPGRNVQDEPLKES